MKTTKKKPAKNPKTQGLYEQFQAAERASETVSRIYNDAQTIEHTAITHLHRFIKDNYTVYVNWITDCYADAESFEDRVTLGLTIEEWLNCKVADIEAIKNLEDDL